MTDVYRIDAAQHALTPSMDDPAALDRLAQYLLNMDEVLVSCPESDRYAWSEVLKGTGVHGEVISTYARDIGAIGIVHHDQSRISTLLVSSGPLATRSRAVKRLFDIVVSGVALLLLAPLFVAVALAIDFEDGGPVFFKQRRMGRGNRFFNILKFRSMREEHADADGNRSASRNDDRITRVGRFLRKTSIDELPQLINVLRGDMSLVGPRPHALGSQAGSKLFWQVDRRYWQRHSLRPGITGLAQVRGYRGATDTERDLTERLQADLDYIQGWTLWRDIGLLISTIRVLVHDRAY
jgi:exopolysaccharide biosynthesis polyprenyl glycosylphosphotransferase